MTPHMLLVGSQAVYQRALEEWRTGPLDSTGRSDVAITDDTINGYVNELTRWAHYLFLPALRQDYGEGAYQITTRAMYSTFPAKETPTQLRERHLDSGRKAVIGLWYFKHPDDAAGGDLDLNGLTVPYAENALVLFPNTLDAWHSVGPRGASLHPRRMINMVGELKAPLHNYRRDLLGRDRTYAVERTL
jgi:hypothetical protein